MLANPAPCPLPSEAEAEAAETARLSTYSSETLFRGQKEIRITHQGNDYRLRITRTGGLILNK